MEPNMMQVIRYPVLGCNQTHPLACFHHGWEEPAQGPHPRSPMPEQPITPFADWTTQEFGRLCGELPDRSDEYWEAGDDEYRELEKQELNPKIGKGGRALL